MVTQGGSIVDYSYSTFFMKLISQSSHYSCNRYAYTVVNCEFPGANAIAWFWYQGYIMNYDFPGLNAVMWFCYQGRMDPLQGSDPSHDSCESTATQLSEVQGISQILITLSHFWNRKCKL